MIFDHEIHETPPSVSILLAVHNGARTLAEQLNALAIEMDQTSELVLIDDASTDESLALAQLYVSRMRMEVLSESSARGKPWCLRRALSSSTGSAIIMLDQDDVIGKGYLSEMALALTDYPLVSARLNYEVLNSHCFREALQNMPNQDTAHIRLRNPHTSEDSRVMVAPGCGLGIQRQLLEQLGGIAEDVECTDDMDLCIRAHLRGITYKRIDRAVLHYRFRDSKAAVFRQRFGYGCAWVALYKKHRYNGMQRRGMRQLCGELYRVARGMLGSRSARITALATLAFLCGRIYGSLKQRTVYI